MDQELPAEMITAKPPIVAAILACSHNRSHFGGKGGIWGQRTIWRDNWLC